jgi:hypothetical protein
LTYTDPSGEGIFGDIFGFIGSFFGNAIFPGLGSLIGWGIGSVADAATGQPISPPGFSIGSAIVGGIAGSVNSGQPWNEQWSIGGGSSGPLRTGSVFGSGNTGLFIFSAMPGQRVCGDFYCDASGNPNMSTPMPASRIGIDDPAANIMLGSASIVAAKGALAVGRAARTAITVGTHPMEVAIGSGDLATSPFHIMFKVGGEWMHANGSKLVTRMIFTRRNATTLAREATRRFTVPILYPATVKALEGTHAWSCATGAIRAFWTGWFGGC